MVRRDGAKHLVEFYPVAAVPTTGYTVLLLGITLNSANGPFGVSVRGKKKKKNYSFIIACNSWFLH